MYATRPLAVVWLIGIIGALPGCGVEVDQTPGQLSHSPSTPTATRVERTPTAAFTTPTRGQTPGNSVSPSQSTTPSGAPDPTSPGAETPVDALVYAGLRLNEVMSNNQSTIQDGDGDYGDWIELYNGADHIIDLAGLGLSDEEDERFEWQFPALEMAPGAYLLVWASGKGESEDSDSDSDSDENLPDLESLHTSFKLSADGETVYLTAPGGHLLDRVTLPALDSDISYGRIGDGDGHWSTLAEPSPGEVNIDESYEMPLLMPVPSIPGGFYPEADLEVSLFAEDGATIYYTLDGSLPTVEATPYDGPLTIEVRHDAANGHSEIPTNQIVNDGAWFQWKAPKETVLKSTVIRAIAVADGRISSPALTQTYFLDDLGPARFALPTVSLSTDPGHFFGYESGIYIPGAQWQEATDEGWVGPDGIHPANYHMTGVEWERPIHLALFDAAGLPVFEADAGVRIHGNTSRAYPYKSLRLYARSDYGARHFDHPFFGEAGLPAYKRFILRNAGGDFGVTLFRDAFNQSLLADDRVESQAYQPCVVYLNGEYWGVHNMRERFDVHYFTLKYDIPEEDVVVLEGVGIVDVGQADDAAHYQRLLEFVKTQDLTEPLSLAWVETQMDIDNFIDYQILQIYVQNVDWPHANTKYWRVRKTPEIGDELDGRWRWLLYDTDHSLHDPASNSLAWATNPDSMQADSTVLLRNLLLNSEFKARFVNRFADSLNTHLAPDPVIAKVDGFEAGIEKAIAKQVKRWNYPGDKEGWGRKVQVYRDFAQLRDGYLFEHIANYFGMAPAVSINISTVGAGRVHVGTIRAETQDGPWQGRYFPDLPIQLHAEADEGYRFIGWQGASQSTDPNLTIEPKAGLSLSAHFESI